MRAEAILVSDCALDFSTAQAFYGRVQRKELSERQLNSVFEQLLLFAERLQCRTRPTLHVLGL